MHPRRSGRPAASVPVVGGAALRAGVGVLAALGVAIGTGSAAIGTPDRAPDRERIVVGPAMSPYAFTVPAGVTSLTVTAYGAAGGAGAVAARAGDADESATVPGGAGGSATALLDVESGEVLRVHVGTRGGDGRARVLVLPDGSFDPRPRAGAAGANGGGAGAASSATLAGACAAGSGGGGGASDVRRGGDDLEDRVVVAAGGGGGGGGATSSIDAPLADVFMADTGVGGGAKGGDSTFQGTPVSTGGGPDAGGAPNGVLGRGGDGTARDLLPPGYPGLLCIAGGGGGAGRFGGGGGDGAAGSISGGAGGSSTPVERTVAGVNVGDGSVVLEYVPPPSAPPPTIPSALRVTPAFAG